MDALPKEDWHSIAVMSKKERPTASDPIITVNMKPLIDEKIGEVNGSIAKKLAASFGNMSIIRLGDTEKHKVAGLTGLEDMYMISINKIPTKFLILSFEKNGIAYTIVYSRKHSQDDRKDFETYRKFLNDVNFINPEKDMDAKLKKLIFEAEEMKER